jgi:threonine dehydrogenase-like Zn-dependent dehydrogenase
VTPFYTCERNQLNLDGYSDVLTGFEFNSENHMWIRYNGTQGEVVVCAPRHRVVLMPDESTIENISAWVYATFFADSVGVEVRGYEGLNKGALFP